MADETIGVTSDHDMVIVRQRVRAHAVDMHFSLVDQTKLVTAASELARNALEYGGGGEVLIEPVSDGIRTGLRLTFVDRGPGIENVELALKDGYSTGGGLGLGLSGARRLVNDFSIDSRPGVGTRVVVTRWK